LGVCRHQTTTCDLPLEGRHSVGRPTAAVPLSGLPSRPELLPHTPNWPRQLGKHASPLEPLKILPLLPGCSLLCSIRWALCAPLDKNIGTLLIRPCGWKPEGFARQKHLFPCAKASRKRPPGFLKNGAWCATTAKPSLVSSLWKCQTDGGCQTLGAFTDFSSRTATSNVLARPHGVGQNARPTTARVMALSEGPERPPPGTQGGSPRHALQNAKISTLTAEQKCRKSKYLTSLTYIRVNVDHDVAVCNGHVRNEPPLCDGLP
jgi:hypothetical protein